ncbi:MAG TPA: amino acid-binding protein [Lachnoclostridium phytofermentans]|uniref:Amino acid-binding protein n=1 Tax=Lachnoclostridium phytofermentans TaxID=66219 RepID=A0A3D2X2T4_9FIRM|nr:ACT domain-containing protein [Lachnoclostridium sp.]HCL01450.1 amino acid-binding protein [Lachnoclostridium phytofermentans]
MAIRQLSVFIENRTGRLEKVTETLKDNGINITSMSLADTSEYGLLRMIVSNPTEGKRVLKEAGFSAMLTDVLAVKLPNKIGMLHELLKVLDDVNIEYMYALATNENASMVIKISDINKGMQFLSKHGFELVEEETAYTINNLTS